MSALSDTYNIVNTKLNSTWNPAYDGPIRVLTVSQGKWTIEAHVVIHPLRRTRDVQNDADRNTCRDEMLRLLEGTHFIFKKAYEKKEETLYYVKPDWEYWRGK